MASPPRSAHQYRRRTVLAHGTTVGAGAVAGCGGSTESTTRASPRANPSTGTAATSTPAQPGPALETTDRPVGFTQGYSTRIDPADYADDSAAIQALNDTLLENLPAAFQQGVIRIPPLKPDGSAWEFPRTITFGAEDSDRVIVPQGTLWGSGGTVTPWKTSIDDGSPVFYVPGNVAEENASAVQMPIGGFNMLGGQGQDCEALRLTNLLLFDLRDVFLVHFAQGPDSDGAVVFEGSCHNAEIDRVRYRGYNRNTEASAQTDVFTYRNREETSGPGELIFGPGCRARFGYGRVLNQTSGSTHPTTFWFGNAESWEREYAVRVTLGSLHMGPTTWFSHPSGESERGGVVDATGPEGGESASYLAVAQGARLGSPVDAPALRLDGLNRFHVDPFFTYGNSVDEPVITVPNAPRFDSAVPHQRILRGTIEAPALEEGVTSALVPGTR
jgi:hypothetical protein